MSSQERHNNKKRYVFKGGNFILSPLNSNNISLNFISESRKEKKKKNNSNIIINNLNTKKSKKNLNVEFIKSNPNLLAFSRSNNSSNKKFVNITNNNIDYIKKYYADKNSKEKSKNFFLNNSKSHNKSFLGQKNLSYEYLKTEINSSYLNILKKRTKIENNQNMNLIFSPRNNFQKSNSNFYNDFLGSSSGLFKKDLPNNLNNKIKEDQGRSENITNQSTNESKINPKKKINIINNYDGNKKRENTNHKGPEEIHWYFVKSIQEGKKYQKKFEL